MQGLSIKILNRIFHKYHDAKRALIFVYPYKITTTFSFCYLQNFIFMLYYPYMTKYSIFNLKGYRKHG